MRARLLVVLVAMALAVVAAFAFPLLSSTAERRTQDLLIARSADVDRFVVLAQQAVDAGDTTTLAAEATRYASLYGEAVLVVDTRKTPLASAGGLAADDVRELIDATLRNQRSPAPPTIEPWSAEPALFARPVGTGTRVAGVVVLRASVLAAAADVSAQWGLIAAGALLAAAVFVLLAVVLARWMVRPLHDLEDGVLAVTAGHHSQVPARAGPRELRSLATSFNLMSDAVVEASEQQRRLVADASHQLRNPMAALRLRVDSLATRVDDEGQRAYRAAVAEVERLESLLDGLLALALAESTATRLAGGHDDEPCDLATVLAERVDAWRPSADQAGASIQPPAGHDEPVLVRCPEAELAQVLDVLLDNAVHYAGRGAHIETEWETDGVEARLVVRDDGPGLSTEERAKATERFWRAGRDGAPRGTGLGLSIAHHLVLARGGDLELRAAPPSGLAVWVTLPLAEERA
ncbi:sensor histidine kinase [Amycolatopsis sp. cg5]|uniref:sensor histidine kinase n=1 Tax=Amycolatopsis sp. cg5 TaxID=3238802 RepID=UPI003526B654